QQRLEQVRRYQLTNPEPATEAMNRLAQAFVCLTDPQARQAYDRALFGEAGAPVVAPPTVTTTTSATTPEQAVDQDVLALVEEEIRAAAQPAVPAPAASPPLLPVEPGEQVVEAKQASDLARKGLGTRRALYGRIVRTRTLLLLWQRAGKYIGQTKRRL